jgi:hypothetical protein
MMMAVFWVAAPFIALMMEAARTSETSLNFYQTTRRYNPEDSHLHSLDLFIYCRYKEILAETNLILQN